MASAAEQLAANLSLGVFSKATELKNRIWFTLGALIIYRIGTYIPIPGVDASVMAEMMQRPGGGLFGMLDMFSGGAVRRVTVFGPETGCEAADGPSLAGEEGKVVVEGVAEVLQGSGGPVIGVCAEQRVGQAPDLASLRVVSRERSSQCGCLVAGVASCAVHAEGTELVGKLFVEPVVIRGRRRGGQTHCGGEVIVQLGSRDAGREVGSGDEVLPAVA